MDPFNIKHAKDAASLQPTETQEMNLHHLCNMFEHVCPLGDHQDEKESQPAVLAMDRHCFEEKEREPSKYYEDGHLPDRPAQPKSSNYADGNGSGQQDERERDGVNGDHLFV